MRTCQEKLLEVNSLYKSYSGVEVLHNLSFDLYAGEIHCLCGENGAGKSTLIKSISGAIPFDSGRVTILGETFNKLSPSVSHSRGIQTIYQENDLVAYMSIAENIYIGQEKSNKVGFISKKDTVESAKKLIAEYQIDLDPTRMVHSISVAEEQHVKILKALANESKILILDEPTSMFNTNDAKKVIDLVKRISEKGIGIIYISHHLKEVVQIADRISVLRDGQLIETISNENHDVDIARIASLMVGRSVDIFYKRNKREEQGNVILEISNLQRNEHTDPLNFCVHAGEILGISGMVGAGRSEMAMAIYGADKKISGTVRICGREVKARHPSHSIENGLVLVPEDRQKQGANLEMSIGENLIMPIVHRIAGFFYLPAKKVREQQKTIDTIKIKAHSPFMPVKGLSGGNQQKVVFGKWINTGADVFIFDEPTRGVDVSSKAELYNVMCDLADQGKAIILISSDMPELIALSDRVLVMRDNRFVAELSGNEITEENIIVKALGV